jgi:hypothetical protein
MRRDALEGERHPRRSLRSEQKSRPERTAFELVVTPTPAFPLAAATVAVATGATDRSLLEFKL